ncbi:MAG: lysophospholipid acyltransferase family protein [Chloroflexi bacterium]|nr:lysophospholipid acyltransferase family protein [Chloroflexota bacterium]MCY3959101.1 lysophospholipid acyltransferase family protein [Chloroflexota bacterium]
MITAVAIAAQAERWVPRPVKFGLARLFGMLVYWLVPRIRRNTTANMSVVLKLPPTDPRVRALAMRSVINYAEFIVDFLRTYRMTQEDVLRRTVAIEGLHHLRAFQDMGRGGIMITAHFGSWDCCGGLVSVDQPTHVVAETFGSRTLTALLDNVRARKNLKTIQLGNAARGILRTLRRGEFVALLADRPTPGKGVQVMFFNCPVWVPEGAAVLARHTGSPLLVGGMIRYSDGTYSAHGMPPIVIDKDRPAAEAVQEAMQQVMWDLERLILKAPAQWYMFRPMWPEALDA